MTYTPTAINVLGVDPGFASFGWSVLDVSAEHPRAVAAGVIRTSKASKKANLYASEDNVARVQEIHKELVLLVRTHSVQAVCAESMSFPRNASAAAKVAMAWGSLAALCWQERLALLQQSPQAVKKHLCGKNDASKEEVEAEVLGRVPGALDVVLASKLPAGQHEHMFDSFAASLACLDSDVLKLLRKNLARPAQSVALGGTHERTEEGQ